MAGAIGGLAAACSGDSLRFAENPFANPFTPFSDTPEPGLTGSIEPKSRASRPALAPVTPSAPRVAAAPAYNRPTGAPSGGGWSSEGGTLLTVKKGDTLKGIAGRYSVPSQAILTSNNITAAQIAPGQRIIIPVYRGGSTAAAIAAPAPVVSSGSVAGLNPSGGRVVSSARLAPKPATERLVEAAPARRVRPGQPYITPAAPRVAQAETRKVVPDPRTTGSVAPKAEPKPVAVKAAAVKAVAKPVAEKPVKAAKVAEPAKVAAAPAPKPAEPKAAAPAKVAAAKPAPDPAKPSRTAAVATKAAEPAKAAPAREIESTASVAPVVAAAAPATPSAEFRWPARGRVINGFGGAGSNEGVNIAVPEGTPIKAAEGGTVAYAGSEVKGYGNLVLIRHENGYVSAYAHAGEIDVKRGQKVNRGQTIAKSGQSGNVTSPQLHFEIRKGSTPVDPMKYLASN